MKFFDWIDTHINVTCCDISKFFYKHLFVFLALLFILANLKNYVLIYKLNSSLFNMALTPLILLFLWAKFKYKLGKDLVVTLLGIIAAVTIFIFDDSLVKVNKDRIFRVLNGYNCQHSIDIIILEKNSKFLLNNRFNNSFYIENSDFLIENFPHEKVLGLLSAAYSMNGVNRMIDLRDETIKYTGDASKFDANNYDSLIKTSKFINSIVCPLSNGS